jgi:hypothetical protein
MARGKRGVYVVVLEKSVSSRFLIRAFPSRGILQGNQKQVVDGCCNGCGTGAFLKFFIVRDHSCKVNGRTHSDDVVGMNRIGNVGKAVQKREFMILGPFPNRFVEKVGCDHYRNPDVINRGTDWGDLFSGVGFCKYGVEWAEQENQKKHSDFFHDPSFFF